MNKFLIILTGTPRGGVKTWKTLVEHLVKPLNADLAICFGKSFINQGNNFLSEISKYDWTFDEPEDWSEYYKKYYSGNWRDFLLRGEDLGMAGGIDEYSGSGSIVSGLKDIIFRNHLDTVLNYDYIIHTRADQYYLDCLPEPNEDKIFIPEGEDYYGICDRFILFHSKYAKSYFSLCEFIDSAIDQNKVPEIVSPESVLLSHLENENMLINVERIKRINFTVSKKGEATRWRIAKYRLHFKQLMIKYPDEFISSVKNLLIKHGIIEVFLKNFVIFGNYLYLNFRRYLGNLKRTKVIKILNRKK